MGMTTVNQTEAHRRRLLIAGAAGLNDAGGFQEGIMAMSPEQEMTDDSDITGMRDLPDIANAVDDDNRAVTK